MSSSAKRSLSDAINLSGEFTLLLAPYCDRIEFAGSIRRQKAEVGDCEIVAIPKISRATLDLFGGNIPENLLLKRLDSLLADGRIRKAVYSNGTNRWGERYRGCEFKGVLHEVFMTPLSSFGPTLAIRTGSAEFSKVLVTGLLRNGKRNKDGKVWECERCPQNQGRGCVDGCSICDGTGLKLVRSIPVPTEEEYFKLAGIEWRKPELR